MELTKAKVYLEDEIKSVSDNFSPMFIQNFMFWYTEWVRKYHASPPNISDLLEEENHYGNLFFDLIAESIIEDSGWTDDQDGYSKAVELIGEDMDDYTEKLEADFKTITSFHQLFYALGVRSVVKGNNLWFEDIEFHNLPIQEVW